MKKVVVGTVASAVILGGAIGAGAMTGGFSSADPAPAEKSDLLTVEEAKDKALAEYEGVVESVELEREANGYKYEIDVRNDDMEYDLDLDASNGEILKAKEERDDDSDDDDRNDDNSTTAASNGTAGSTSEDYITQEEAVEIALAEVSGTLESVELDDDDGRAMYEVEINTDSGDDDDAEFDIDAVTGEILEMDMD
ncbi:hypothetical protein KP77_05100 [Jeotgalibacillus alimentarius]|uniref:PepSY domain-containing protein n=1 Tax=Jeotgalibacillus alimentarius TaxID=135826 RepID=A0A0C2SHW8_9BACL|nr:PepSY domain-containing protein [Jeotgalibacillus alimentarius]KIL53534.1 hypothetical protein KP77_05100 [Jeotgalibacillus alimentarius]